MNWLRSKIMKIKFNFLSLLLTLPFCSCVKTASDAPATTPASTGSCTYNNRSVSYPTTYDFITLPAGFTHSATTDQLIASGGVGVLQSVISERLDIMYGLFLLTDKNRKLKIDFSFTGTAHTNNNVTLYSNDILGANTYYHAQISKAGALYVLKLLNGTTALSNFKVISPAPASGTLELTVCDGIISATVGGDSATVTDSSVLTSGRIGFMVHQTTGGTAGSVSVDNFGVFIP